MKTTFKRLFAVVLALIMALGSASAFAAEGEILMWNIYDADKFYEFSYAGEYTGEKIVIDNALENHSYYEYYDFNVTQAGYYTVEVACEGESFSVLFPERIEDGKAYGYASYRALDSGLVNDTFTYKRLYYFSEGESFIGFVYADADAEIEIEFLGAEITDIEFAEDFFVGVMGYDIYVHEGTGPSDTYASVDYAKVVFSSGETIDIEDQGFLIKHENALVKGENTAEVVLFEYSEPVTITLFEITDYISDVEIINADEYITVTEFYTGDWGFAEINEEAQFSVTFTDGRKETFKEYITLPNGKKYAPSLNIIGYNDGCMVDVYVADELYATYNAKRVPASFDDNLNQLGYECRRWINRANYDAQYRIEQLGWSDNISEKVSLVSMIPFLYTNAVFQIFCNFVEFIEYYAAI